MPDTHNPTSELAERLSSLTTEARDSSLDLLDTLPILERCAIQNRMDSEVTHAVSLELPKIADAVSIISRALSAGGRLFYFGAGTSGRLGVLDASECPPTFGTDPNIVQGIIAGGNIALTTAVEGVEDSIESGHDAVKDAGVTSKDIVVGITASGRTPFVLGALNYASELGATTIGVTNNKDSELAFVCSGPCIEVVVGPELISGSTRLKAGSAQKLILNMLTTQTMIELGKTHGSAMVDVQATNSKLKIRALRMVCELTGASKGSAALALEQASGSAKLAILMLLKNLDTSAAKKSLELADGKLRRALEM